MIFRLKTSKTTEDIFKEIERRTFLKPFTLVKHAIVWSVREGCTADGFQSDSNGLDLNRQTITGDYDVFFKVMIEEVEGRFLEEEEYFPDCIKRHIDRGALILRDRFKQANDLDDYIRKTFGVGDTV